MDKQKSLERSLELWNTVAKLNCVDKTDALIKLEWEDGKFFNDCPLCTYALAESCKTVEPINYCRFCPLYNKWGTYKGNTVETCFHKGATYHTWVRSEPRKKRLKYAHLIVNQIKGELNNG